MGTGTVSALGYLFYWPREATAKWEVSSIWSAACEHAHMEATFLASLRKNSAEQTILAVTHKPNVMNICDRVIIIDNGKIGWDGKLSEYISLVTQNQEQQAKNN